MHMTETLLGQRTAAAAPLLLPLSFALSFSFVSPSFFGLAVVFVFAVKYLVEEHRASLAMLNSNSNEQQQQQQQER